MRDLKIKVCGMRDPENIEALSVLMPDFMGFIFYPPSKRFIGLDFEKAHLKSIDKTIIKTAVFVNATLAEVLEFSKAYDMQAVQLHGSESPEFCEAVKEAGFFTIKAFGVDGNFDFGRLNAYESAVDAFLFDTKTELHGGSGKTFDWRILEKYQLNKPFFLSGGIDLPHLEQILTLNFPQLCALDLNSKFETEPGSKNINKLKTAFETLRR
ncbi:N-(5'-phosphoribosyl)anthranilate isomerase [Pelobium manganitolerans]|uniref:N-(5'-phosphoribosyl)anthranilate isomerase n=1 Tax=Pelobium manganitolerans TaxID=1842495 RepID=A0A419S634_9SPHI|nr:phosphoribosylanthranilate isomerase [Pelobium manganitolerans]RKD16273.1 N-(5'-phosphoribosyl)anthranilate isomerase [Pelobium manganitolerans]